jgi:hypothetical protein
LLLVTPAMVLQSSDCSGAVEDHRPAIRHHFRGLRRVGGAGYTSSVDGAATYAQTIVLAKILLICFVIANIADGWRMRVFMIFFLAWRPTPPAARCELFHRGL